MEIVILFLYPSHEIYASSAKLMYHKNIHLISQAQFSKTPNMIS